MQYDPPAHLSDCIKHYLILDIPASGQKRIRHFSNGHHGLVFTLKKKVFTQLPYKTPLPKVFTFGQLSEHQEFAVNGATILIIVLFRPSGFFKLTGIPAHMYANRCEDAVSIFGKEILELNERMEQMADLDAAIHCLNAFFTKKQATCTSTTSALLEYAIPYIYAEKGNISIKTLCSATGASERKIQRAFSEQIGVAPKKFSNTVKLHYFLGLVRSVQTPTTLTALGLDAGYYDQAHLIREFKNIVGLAPSKYLKTERLAVNLVEL